MRYLETAQEALGRCLGCFCLLVFTSAVSITVHADECSKIQERVPYTICVLQESAAKIDSLNAHIEDLDLKLNEKDALVSELQARLNNLAHEDQNSTIYKSLWRQSQDLVSQLGQVMLPGQNDSGCGERAKMELDIVDRRATLRITGRITDNAENEELIVRLRQIPEKSAIVVDMNFTSRLGCAVAVNQDYGIWPDDDQMLKRWRRNKIPATLVLPAHGECGAALSDQFARHLSESGLEPGPFWIRFTERLGICDPRIEGGWQPRQRPPSGTTAYILFLLQSNTHSSSGSLDLKSNASPTGQEDDG